MNYLPRIRCLVFAGLITSFLTAAYSAAAPTSQVLPLRTLSSYRSGNVRHFVTVTTGMIQLVMEKRTGSAWAPIKVQNITLGRTERARNVFVTPPAGVKLADIRMVGRRTPVEPAAPPKAAPFYERFEDIPPYIGPYVVTPGRLTDFISLEMTQLQLSGTVLTNTARATAPSTALPPPQEADIWQVIGNRLLFFNQYRGLQIFDLTNPAVPVRLGGLRLPVNGDQLYVLDSAARNLALVGRGNGASSGGAPATVIYFVRLNEQGVPELTHELLLPGLLLDGRLMGNRLHFLSHLNLPPTNHPFVLSMQSLATIHTVDVSDIDAPALLQTLEIGPSHLSKLQASGRYLLVGTSAYQPLMHILDTEAPNGGTALLKTVVLKGAVQDKFKMGVVNGAAVAVTQPGVTGVAWRFAAMTSQTWVETFAIEGPETAPLAQLELVGARNEALFGTRFDGDRLYVVTLMVSIARDPLFIVDLANPAQPVVRAALEIPGWSTYLEPHGDRIVAVGMEGNRVAVSLFDVTDADHPTLASRLLLGDGFSSSEANVSEKAVEFFPESGTLLVPFQSNAGNSMVQSIHVGRDELTKGLAIPHDGYARRGAVVGNHLVSISGSELKVHDSAAALATPVAEVSLAWHVDRVAVFGDYLVQVDEAITTSYDSVYRTRPVMLRVSRRADPDALLGEFELQPGLIVGLAQKAHCLYVAQWLPKEDGAALRTWVLDLKHAPEISVVATLEHSVVGSHYNLERVEALWPTPDTLVWHLPVMQSIWAYHQPVLYSGVTTLPITTLVPQLIARPGLTLTTASSLPPLSQIATTNGLMLAPVHRAITLCPIATGTSVPVANPVIQCYGKEPTRGNSRAFSIDGVLYVSYDSLGEPFPVGEYGWQRRRVCSWLQPVDFTLTTPLVRAPVSIPGVLLHITKASGPDPFLLFTRTVGTAVLIEHIQACNFDGVGAHLLATHELTGTADLCESNGGATLYLAGPCNGPYFFAGGSGSAPGVTTLSFDSTSKTFTASAFWPTPGTPTALKSLPNLLLVAGSGFLESARISASGTLTPSSSFETIPNLDLPLQRMTQSAPGILVPALDYGVEFLSLQDLNGD